MANDPMSSMADMECNKLFDHIDDLLHFSDDDINNTAVEGTTFSGVWSASPHSLLNPDSVMETGCSVDLATALSIPYEDVVQMEWLSRFMEDSFGAGNTLSRDTREFPVAAAAVTPTLFRSSSPVSVLESRSSSSSSICSSSEGGKIMPISPEQTRIGCGRARSKSARPPTFNSGSAMQLISPAQSLIESHCLTKASNSSGPKRIKKSPKPSRRVEITRNVEEVGVRKCLHCGINKTPQWRAGPLGPKTLCNACGVRYKSGRLFPEYRPAASPTFVPSLHSNSHKKVLEMRTTTVDNPPNTTSSQDLIDDVGRELFIPNKDALILFENM